jgi:hypothetical protein
MLFHAHRGNFSFMPSGFLPQLVRVPGGIDQGLAGWVLEIKLPLEVAIFFAVL